MLTDNYLDRVGDLLLLADKQPSKQARRIRRFPHLEAQEERTPLRSDAFRLRPRTSTWRAIRSAAYLLLKARGTKNMLGSVPTPQYHNGRIVSS